MAEARYAAPPSLEPTGGAEQYAAISETGFQDTREFIRSTFSVDVDTAAYSNVRRFLQYGQRPPADAVRVEEMINYFDYDYREPAGPHPIELASELTVSPFDPRKQLLRVSLCARDSERKPAPPRNLVFLLDVSGSMEDDNKLPLLKRSIELMLPSLGEQDTVSIVTYAGASGVALWPTSGANKERILQAVARLEAEGSTNGAQGIELAYDLALRSMKPGAINRVILATDGDFNVGTTSREGLLELIERRRAQGVYLTVLGFGMGNLNDATLELLADHGNGNYAYIDTEGEARKVLVDEIHATLHTVAKDVKLQLTWDAAKVARYRLIGYENRRLADRDFDDDRKDAGDLGDGHRVTALYELEMTEAAASEGGAIVQLDVRYKRPEALDSALLSHQVSGQPRAFAAASRDTRFASAVAGFGMLLRGSPYRGALDFAGALAIARGALGDDPYGQRRELVRMMEHAQELYEN